MTDPVLKFDNTGQVFLVVEPLRFDPNDITVTGIQVFRSMDGGQTWMESKSLIIGRTVDENDDKSWMACDRSNNQHTHGRVYVVWGGGGNLRFARTLDGGETWRGMGNLQAGSDVPGMNGVYAPSITIGNDGIVHVFWHLPGSNTISYTRSSDGGETFEQARIIVNNMTSLSTRLPVTGGFPHFPNAEFRVLTLTTCCVLPGERLLIAWSDIRDGLARIYYRLSNSGGQDWSGSESGQPLLPTFPTNNGLYHFHPQLSITKTGVVGCAFYEFGPKDGGYKIDTRVAQGESFDYITTVTDKPWDPAVNAPLSHGDEGITFIGEYFGFDADDNSFAVVWTDTRTGVQELFYDRISTQFIPNLTGNFGRVTVGVENDGGGVIILGGQILKVPPTRTNLYSFTNDISSGSGKAD
ncbi:hypothetical protein ACT7DB_16735 [Bacillus cereus]